MKKLILILFTLFKLASAGQNAGKRIIFFKPNQSEVSTLNKSRIDSLVYGLRDKDYFITLIGHADSVGKEITNLSLSKKRTKNVEAYLVLKGIEKLKISSKYSGEENPPFANSIAEERVKNRCVEISITSNNPFLTQIDSKPKKSENQIENKNGFEKDTVIYCRNGARIVIDSRAFYPRKVSEVDFNISEVYSVCDILKSNSTTQTEDGNCLSSAGMIYIRPTINSVEVQPNKGQMVTLKLPMKGGKPDPEMKVYFAVKNKAGETVWKEKASKLSYEENGNKYYVFKVDTLIGFNIDKPLGITCQKDGPKIRIKKFKNIQVCQTYPDEIYLSKGMESKKRVFVIDKVLMNKNPQLTILAYDKNGFPYMAKGPLSSLKFNKRKNTYTVSSKYFHSLVNNFSEKKTPNDYLCNYLEN